MDKKIKIQLEADVRPEDFAQSFQPIITAIGIKAALDLCRYSGGIQQYIPLYDEVLEGPRNRAITKEFDGSNNPAAGLEIQRIRGLCAQPACAKQEI